MWVSEVKIPMRINMRFRPALFCFSPHKCSANLVCMNFLCDVNGEARVQLLYSTTCVCVCVFLGYIQESQHVCKCQELRTCNALQVLFVDRLKRAGQLIEMVCVLNLVLPSHCI